MAGTPENITPPVLDAGAKRRMDKYWSEATMLFPHVLKLKESWRHIGHFSNVIRGLQEIGVELPSSLIYQLNLDKLKWWHLPENTGVFIASIGADPSQLELDIDQRYGRTKIDDTALATLSITKQAVPNTPPETWKPFHLNVAGIANDRSDNKRIVVVSYDLPEGKLAEFNVSVTHDEQPSCLDVKETLYGYRPGGPAESDILPRELNTNFDAVTLTHPLEHAAGLVTQAMKKHTLPHQSELLFFHVDQGSVFPGKNLPQTPLSHKGKAKAVMEELGYFMRIEGDMTTIGFRGISRNVRGIEVAPWEISVPASL